MCGPEVAVCTSGVVNEASVWFIVLIISDQAGDGRLLQTPTSLKLSDSTNGASLDFL